MAFVARSERKLVLGNTNSLVGPGTYVNPPQYKSAASYAPFSSSTERIIDKPIQNYTPGPGSYMETSSQNRVGLLHSSPFASARPRFDFRNDNMPGPGSYNIKSHWTEKKVSYKPQASSNYIRLPSAPSIPGANQGYGYDETSNGELVVHKGPNYISGKIEDSVGPGHYNPKSLTPNRGALWHKSNSKRTQVFSSKNQVPGPGTYVPQSQVPRYKLKPNAVFASNCKRGTEFVTEDSSEDGVPGPGQYMTKSAFSLTPSRFLPQNFGSRCERFKNNTPEPLGPGCYNLPVSGFSKKKAEKKAPFCSTDLRFHENIDVNPGPGAYKEVEIQKKVWGKQGVFGSTERRFYSKVKTKEIGPGEYTADSKIIGMHNSAKNKGNAVFLSKAKRIAEVPLSETPPPGAYDITSPIGQVKSPRIPNHPVLVREHENLKTVGFNAQADRFFNSSTDVPGPGTYKITEKSLNKKPNISKEKRFKDNKNALPGPGTYQDQANWNRKTFNILFE